MEAGVGGGSRGGGWKQGVGFRASPKKGGAGLARKLILGRSGKVEGSGESMKNRSKFGCSEMFQNVPGFWCGGGREKSARFAKKGGCNSGHSHS